MKYCIIFVLLHLSITLASGQSTPTTKIYLVKNGSMTLSGVRFYTTLDRNKPIVVKNNAYTVIETDADSLGILPDGPYRALPDDDYRQAIRKTIYVPLEKGKTYYFKVGQVYQSRFFDVNDLSEQAFKLFVGINRINETPQYYFLSKSGESLSKQP